MDNVDKQFALIGGKRIVFPVRLQEINLLLLYIEMAIQISAQLPVLKKNYQPSELGLEALLAMQKRFLQKSKV